MNRKRADLCPPHFEQCTPHVPLLEVRRAQIGRIRLRTEVANADQHGGDESGAERGFLQNHGSTHEANPAQKQQQQKQTPVR